MVYPKRKPGAFAKHGGKDGQPGHLAERESGRTAAGKQTEAESNRVKERGSRQRHMHRVTVSEATEGNKG